LTLILACGEDPQSGGVASPLEHQGWELGCLAAIAQPRSATDQVWPSVFIFSEV